MNKTTFSIPKMDCGAEEQLVKMALHGQPGVHRIEADLTARELLVLHEGSADTIAAVLVPLNLGTVTVHTTIASQLDERTAPRHRRRGTNTQDRSGDQRCHVRR